MLSSVRTFTLAVVLALAGNSGLMAQSAEQHLRGGLQIALSSPTVATTSPLLGPPSQREGTITGQVVRTGTNQGIAAAQVTITGLSIGTLTQADGRFVMQNVPAGTHTLQVTRLGYTSASQEVAVQTGETANVRLEITQAAIGLDELVVTGVAGATQRRTLGNSLARISAAEVAEVAPVRQMQDMLQGRTPGAFVRQSSGVVGTGAQITIRGQSSLLLGSNPLIYVDGIRVDNSQNQGEPNVSRLEDLNLGEVESIEVIRGPAAATLYGTEAAAGVVQIITKRGQVSAPMYDFQLSQGTMWIHDPQSHYWPAYHRMPDGSVRELRLYEQESQLGLDPFQYGRVQGFQAQVSGGTDGIRYYASGGFDKDQGFMRPNKRTAWAGRTNVSITPSDALTINTSLGLTMNDTDLVDTRGTIRSVGGALYRGRPHLLDGPTRGWPAISADDMYDMYQQNQTANKFTGSLQATHRPTGWLEHRLTFGADISAVEHTNFIPRVLDPAVLARLTPAQREGQMSNTLWNTLNTTLDYGATGTFDLSDELRGRTSVGLQYYDRSTKQTNVSGEGFPAPGLRTVGATAERTGSGSFVQVATVGTYVQQEVHWRDLLYLTAAVRGDDNSAFGEDFSWVIYPKVSGSWVVSETDFFDLNWVNQFRVRAAFGSSGRQPDAFAALRTFTPRTGSGDQASVTPSSVGNPDLSPERGQELELGFEAGLFSDRLGVDFTAYNQTTKDVIVSRINAPSSGFPGNQFTNAGQVDSWGFELDLFSQVRPGLNLDFNVSYNHNEIIDLGGLPPIVRTAHTSGVMDVPGFAPGSHFAPRVVSAEFDENFNAINYLCDGGTGPSGMARGGPAVPCGEAGRVFMGNAVPPWQGTFGVTWNPIQDLTLRTSFGWVQGAVKFNQNRWVTCTSYQTCHENVFPEEHSPEVVTNAQRGGGEDLIDMFYEDASFLKLREVTALYRLPDNILGTGARRASISLGARNLATWSRYGGGDPEGMSSAADTLDRIDDMGGLPIPVQLILTMRLGF